MSPFRRIRQVQNTTNCHNISTANLNSIGNSTVPGGIVQTNIFSTNKKVLGTNSIFRKHDPSFSHVDHVQIWFGAKGLAYAAKIPKHLGERRLPSGRPRPIGSLLLAGVREFRIAYSLAWKFFRSTFHIFPFMLSRMNATRSLWTLG